MQRRSLSLPITLAVVMIVILVLLTVGWVIITQMATNFSAARIVLLIGGATAFALMVGGVVIYLILSIKAINLSRRQSNFIDSVTHELKSPIASLKLYLQTLKRRNVSPEEQQEFYRFMLEDVDRLDNLINHVLDAARLDRTESPLEESMEVELSELLHSCADVVRARYQAGPETVRLNLTPCLVKGSPVDLEMVFRNLLDNAFKYAGDPPEVRVHLSELYNGRIAIRIEDNGNGIPTRERHRIFRRFVRLGTELERTKPGTGLGLYIVGTLVKKLRGRIRVRSRERHSGTVFEVTFAGRLANSIPPDDTDPVTTDSSIAFSTEKT